MKRMANKQVLKWFLINCMMVAFFLVLRFPLILEKPPEEMAREILRFVLPFFLIASSAEAAGIYVSRFFQDRTFPVFFLYTFPVVLAASLTAMLLCIWFDTLVSSPDVSLNVILKDSIASAPATTLLSFVLTLVFSRIGYLQFRNKLLEDRRKVPHLSETEANAGHKKENQPHSGLEALSIKEGENYFLIPYSDITYLSAHGKSTILHTKMRDYRSTKLLKELERLLPEDRFLRIHKSFLVHLPMISHIQYFLGGSYLAFLKDEDETNLPVGRAYASDLKVRMKL